jgi:hypothetical protein
MLMDALLQLSAAQAVTTTAVTVNTIDLLQIRDSSDGRDLYGVVTIDTTATGSGTVAFEFIASTAANLSSPIVLSGTGPIPIADLVAGRAPIMVPLGSSNLRSAPIGYRWLGGRFTVTSGPLTGGAFSFTVTDAHIDVNRNYPANRTIF